MSFTFTNAISPELAKNPLSNLVGNILSGYTGVTQARYLRPQLEEELKKAKLYNQYYGPNIESEIGLRGAQAGHYGALTQGLNISNPFLRKKLEQEQQEREFKLNNPFFGQTGTSGDVGRMLYLKQMLQANPDLLQGMGGMGGLGGQPGQQGQSNQMPQQDNQSFVPSIAGGLIRQGNVNLNNRPQVYNPETGGYSTVYSMGIGLDNGKEALIPRVSDDGRILSEQQAIQQFRDTGKHLGIYGSKSEANKAAEQLHQQQANMYGNPTQNQPSSMDMINQAISNKLKDADPQYKAWVDIQTSGMKKKEAEEFKLEAKKDFEDFKDSSNAQKDIPVLKDALQNALRMRKIIKSRPAFWGHYWFPERFEKKATDPLAGEFQGELIPHMAALESQLSHNGNQLALKTSAKKLPGFDDTQAVGLGKMDALINTLQKRIQASENLAGGNIVRRGNKRFILQDGKWYKVKR